ncbi:K(+)-transporting ATPase subunit B [Rhodovarius crocodyli]|uniref:Potassium-transporting ATPase ATP-binding subunit n=1 Tax=Rhodovarius crocodyli TaxID=1979269 RepID=A0A437LX93_9PROT|nr:potassium-transporting ATPase subunit KdpB [Rhodovarius crocodyli]RVT90004.1 K(+)-transporting ATPase subunit B [Rhodovarius crocodyli]
MTTETASVPLSRVALDALRKLNPITLLRNPVIFVTEVVSILVTLLAAMAAARGEPWAFQAGIAAWLWLTVLFANAAEAVAEGRGRARAESLRRARGETRAKLMARHDDRSLWHWRDAPELRENDVVLVEAGDLVPADGEVIQGIASVNEAAVTGESAPVIRESGGDRSAVTGGTLVVSDWLVVRVTAAPGNSFLDRMIALVEGAARQKTPNEIALDILLAGLTIVFLIAVASVVGLASFNGTPPSVPVLAALLVTLIPTTIGGLLSAIGIAGMDRLVRFNVVATSGRAVEAAGDVDVLLLDKTGTITLGNRQAAGFFAAPGVSEAELAEAAMLASLADETPEGRSILAFARDRYGLSAEMPQGAAIVPFTAQTRISGLDIPGRGSFRKGAVDRMGQAEVKDIAERIARAGATPLAVARDGRVLGVIELKDIVKPGMRDRFDALRRMGIRTVMVTGDNRLTAAAIAAEAGVDDFIAEATPEDKLAYIRNAQKEGRLVAMAGDGTNDAPALAQADVGLAMQTGTQAAREAGNMVDLDSDPTKLIEVVEIGKQLLITRGALTTFSIANDVAKYFAILPAIFVAQYPGLAALNVMGLNSPESAILSAVIFNALIIIALVPLALKGVRYAPVGAAALLRRNLLIYGLGGVVAPFIGIKIIDLILGVF